MRWLGVQLRFHSSEWLDFFVFSLFQWLLHPSFLELHWQQLLSEHNLKTTFQWNANVTEDNGFENCFFVPHFRFDFQIQLDKKFFKWNIFKRWQTSHCLQSRKASQRGCAPRKVLAKVGESFKNCKGNVTHALLKISSFVCEDFVLIVYTVQIFSLQVQMMKTSFLLN